MLRDAASLFEERFGHPPTHLARAPGRVNLIGEHTDYNDLPVFPIAIQREARVALRPREDGMVVLHSADPAFPSVEFEVFPGIPPEAAGHWGNYVKGPANELARRYAIWRGFDGVLASDVPVAAGLSSSSAIVTAVGLALAHINEVAVEERSFAELLADAERYTGTRGGGMDQTISLGARSGCAAKVAFNPLRLQHVPVPEGWSFVVADTGVTVEKSGPAQKAYNLRRTECEDAFEQVVDEVVASSLARTTPTSYPDLLRLLGPEEALTLAEEVLDRTLFRRFRHVVSEAGRVEEAVDRLRSADLTGFGTLMDASHGSLRTDFLMSSAELDELTAIAREGGAVGARLTGAGLGGCIVALADRQTVGTVLETLVGEYYEPRDMTEDIDA
ncbi:MAG: galactokinase, partial [Thermoleophilia bacterium]|nr:galactokinase [Thermoleophilia bacterium]